MFACYECKKPRHIRQDCPLFNKVLKRKMKKALFGTWSDDKASSSSDEEETKNATNLCLMGLEDEVTFPEPQSKFTLNKLILAFHE